jgi:hypothetical protein
MARPKRASSLSTTKVTFRLTADEARQLDELVKELGFKDRSGLVRSWLAQSRSVARGTSEVACAPVEPNAATTSVDTENNMDETAAARPSPKEDPPNQPVQANDLTLNDLFVLVVAAIHREADERSGWSRIPNAVRLLLAQVTPAQFFLTMDFLQRMGMLEVRPPNGRTERLRIEDAALCPRDSRGKVLSRARLIGKWRDLMVGILPPNPQ